MMRGNSGETVLDTRHNVVLQSTLSTTERAQMMSDESNDQLDGLSVGDEFQGGTVLYVFGPADFEGES